MLSLPARQAIFRSMSLQMVSGGTTIISQGDTDATKFYVLEKGTCDVLISTDATGNVPKKVHTYTSGRCGNLVSAKIHSSIDLSQAQTPLYRPGWGKLSCHAAGHAFPCLSLLQHLSSAFFFF